MKTSRKQFATMTLTKKACCNQLPPEIIAALRMVVAKHKQMISINQTRYQGL